MMVEKPQQEAVAKIADNATTNFTAKKTRAQVHQKLLRGVRK